MDCQREVVKKALANLPKTLDKTYDRIFLAILEEDRPIVYHALQWILYHNEVYHGQGIPSVLLSQGLAKSVASLDGNPGDRFYDSGTLRELCGCLISITSEVPYHASSTHATVLTVSFAHYTVREYLDSIRIRKAAAFHFNAYPEDLQLNCIELILTEALNVEPNDLWEREMNFSDRDDRRDVRQALEESFNTHCILGAFLSLRKWPCEISQHDRLCTMAFNLMDPSRPNHWLLLDVCATMERLTELFSDYGWDDTSHFWEVQVTTSKNIEASQLLNLLFLSVYSKACLVLVRKFLEGRDVNTVLQAALQFTWYSGAIGPSKKKYEGTIIEIFAQFAIWGS